jgi:hypothetical protein
MQFGQWAKSARMILPILNARPYLMILGDLVAGWKLIEGAGIAFEKLINIYEEVNAGDSKAQRRAEDRSNPEAAFYQGKIASATYFAANILSTIKGRCEAIQSGDKTPIEMLEESF